VACLARGRALSWSPHPGWRRWRSRGGLVSPPPPPPVQRGWQGELKGTTGIPLGKVKWLGSHRGGGAAWRKRRWRRGGGTPVVFSGLGEVLQYCVRGETMSGSLIGRKPEQGHLSPWKGENAVIWPLLACSDTTGWTKCHLGRRGGGGALFRWL
jgi:hypothetical protein